MVSFYASIFLAPFVPTPRPLPRSASSRLVCPRPVCPRPVCGGRDGGCFRRAGLENRAREGAGHCIPQRNRQGAEEHDGRRDLRYMSQYYELRQTVRLRSARDFSAVAVSMYDFSRQLFSPEDEQRITVVSATPKRSFGIFPPECGVFERMDACAVADVQVDPQDLSFSGLGVHTRDVSWGWHKPRRHCPRM